MKKFAVFDIDGTLIRWQLFHAIIDRLAKQQHLGPDAAKTIKEARLKWKQREHPDAFYEYEQSLIAVYDAALLKLDPKLFDQVITEITNEYKSQVYTYTSQLIKVLKTKGYVLLAISGSPHEGVKQVAETYGFDDYVGNYYERQGDRFTGQRTRSYDNKKVILEDLMAKHQLTLKGSIGVGDTNGDLAFLEMVEQPIAFNPNQALLEIAKERHWKIVVERKNVVYELEDHDGKYLLA
jgi:HAD superfamily hydrolase (TIGR01490 family)